jgi:DNA repair protein SbcD/Mre11
LSGNALNNKPLRILHFADAHIDIANYGRHDPNSALPVRVMDYLRSLDQIVDTAVSEKVDLVIFAGDAYKDRNPQPTFQREWGRRMMRLSEAEIPTLLLIGNHDKSPASGRAHTLQEFGTLNVPYIHVADNIHLWQAEELGVDAQVISVPWVSRSQLMAREEVAGMPLEEVLTEIEERVTKAILNTIISANTDLPLILTAHASVQGAVYGSERAVMLGHELILGGQVINDPRLDYVALGHIHKHQLISPVGSHPPVVYPGSIERIDFGEAKERKGFVIAEISKGQAQWDFIPLKTRRFLDISLLTPDPNTFMQDILDQLPDPADLSGAICRLKLAYSIDWEPLLDEKRVANHFEQAFSLQIQKNRLSDKRARLGDTIAVESLTPLQLLEQYWLSTGLDSGEIQAMQTLAQEILSETEVSQK